MASEAATMSIWCALGWYLFGGVILLMVAGVALLWDAILSELRNKGKEK